MLIEKLIAQAEEFEDAGLMSEALGRWREALAIERRPEVLARLGRLCTQQGQLAEAEGLLVEAVERAPELSDAHYYLGFLYERRDLIEYQERRDLLEQARMSLERALELEEWAPGFTKLGEVYRRLGMQSEAQRAFLRATMLDANDDEAWYGVGLVYKTEDEARSIEAFQRSLAIDPNHGAAHRELGYMQLRQNDLAAAERSLRTALQLNPDDAWAHDYLGNILLSADRAEEAEEAFRRAIALWPEPPLFHSNLGDALRAMGRLQESERAYLHALSLDIGNYLANLRMGELLIEQGKLTTARSYLERALQAKPNERRALRALDRIGGHNPSQTTEER